MLCSIPAVTLQLHSTNHWTLLPVTTPVCTPHPAGRRGPPSVEVEGKMYSIVDPIKRETDTTYQTTVAPAILHVIQS